jgi:2-polyprenyl-3-methyl-5-hydroxy-6-metoxy-1,4-benzoquinol methylase
MNPGKTQDTYNRLWRTVWGDVQSIGPVHRHMRIHLVRTVSSLGVTRILEVGCGSGENLAALANAGRYELTGVDIAQEALHVARRRNPNARYYQMDIEKETLLEEYDLVLSLQVLEHILDDMSALKNIARMTGNYVLVSTVQGRMRSSEIEIGHVRNYSRSELKSKLEVTGLDVLNIWGWGFPFYSPVYRTLAEWLPGGPPRGPIGRWGLLGASFLFHLYRLNWPGRGDILFALARKRKPGNQGHAAKE